MKKAVSCFLLVLGLLAVSSTVTHAGGCEFVSFSIEKQDRKNKKANLDIKWADAIKDCTYTNKDGRITEKMPVTIAVNNYNFLHYGLEIEIEEEVVDAYAELAEFWDKFLSLDTYLDILDDRRSDRPPQPDCRIRAILKVDSRLSACLDAAGDFEAATVNWRKKLREARAFVASSLKDYNKLALSDDDKGAIEEFRKNSLSVVKILEAYKTRSLELASTNKELDRFDKTDAVHSEIIEGLRRVNARAKLVKNGFIHGVKKKKPGTIVSVKLIPTGLEGVGAEDDSLSKKQVTVRYFVQSRHPLVFHAGLAYSDVDEVEFSKIRSAAGEDLFSKIQDEDSELDLTGFLSYQFLSYGRRNDQGLLITVGTDFDEPGKRAYFGLSHRWGRWLLTGGWVRAEVEQGEETTTDPDLFRTISSGSDDGGFASISFKLLGVN